MDSQNNKRQSKEEAIDTLRSYWNAIYHSLADKLNDDIRQEEVGVEMGEEIIAAMKKIRNALKLLNEASAEAELAESVLMGVDTSGSRNVTSGLRQIEVNVTEGMINISGLSLTGAVKKGILQLGETMRITLPDGKTFVTTIESPGNRLKERGLIAQFFKSENIEPYSSVYFKEIAHGDWLLYGPNSAEFQKEISELLGSFGMMESVSDSEISAQNLAPDRGSRGILHIEVDWRAAGKDRDNEIIQEATSAGTLAAFIAKLREVYGGVALQKLSDYRTGRGPLVTTTPMTAYQNHKSKQPYSHREIPNASGYFVLTHSSTREKILWIAKAAQMLGLPTKALKISTTIP
jgi:hypothetical protein